MKKSQTLIILVFIVIVSLIVFFYNKPNETRLQKVTVMMPFISQIQWAPYYTAKFKGFYADEGLDVEMQYSTQGSAGPIEQLIGGSVDFIHTDKESIIMANSKGIDVVSVYLIEPTNVFYIVSKKNKNVTKPSDLIGKKIGLISSASGAYANLMIILHNSNISENSVEIVQAGTAVVPSFLEDKFDAAAIHLSQKLLIEYQGVELNVINASDYTNVSSNHIAVTKNFLDKNPELIRKFLRATKKGLEYAVNNPEKAVEMYISFNPDAISKRNVSQELWNTFIKVHNYEMSIPNLDLYQDWKSSQDILYDVGLITSKVDVSKIYTNDFVPK